LRVRSLLALRRTRDAARVVQEFGAHSPNAPQASVLRRLLGETGSADPK
jgi:hypothetical protein